LKSISLLFLFFLFFIKNLSADNFQDINEKNNLVEEKNSFKENDKIYRFPRPCIAIFGTKHIENGGVGYDHGYTTAEVMAFPVRKYKKVCSFIDLRYHVLNNAKQAFNIGAGFRYSPDFLKCAFGLNVYYDFRDKRCNFHQIGIGGECLSERWEFRVNGYFPINDEKIIQRCHFDEYTGDYFITRNKIRAALTGFDLEVGRVLNNPDSNVNAYSAVGTYYYGGNDVCRRTWGGRVRFNVNVFKYLLFEGIVTFDYLFHTRGQGLIKVNIPFGCKTRKKHKDVFSKHVQRHEIIVLDKYCKWKWNY
jgi:hypothetical protein